MAAEPYFDVSTSKVPPQNRLLDSDVERHFVLHFEGDADAESNVSLPQKWRVTNIRVVNGGTALDGTNTVTLDIDVNDPAASTEKKHDVASYNSASTGDDIEAGGYADLTLSSTEADLVVDSDEILQVAATVVTGTIAEFNVVVSYKLLSVSDYDGDWPASV